MYLFSRFSANYSVEVVPGIPSINAAAIALGRPLVACDETLKILPGTLENTVLEKELATSESAIFVKTGRHFPRVREILVKTGHAESAYIIQHVSGVAQNVCPVLEFKGDALPYFSIILCYLGQEDWGKYYG